MKSSRDRDQWRQLSNGTWVPLRLEDDSPAAKDAIAKVLGPPGTSILQPWRGPGGPRTILASYELVRHELNALTAIVDALLIGRHARSYAGNIRLLNQGRARSIMGQVLVDPIVDERNPLAPAMRFLQVIRGQRRHVELNRSSFVLERNFEGDVDDDGRAFVELRERLGNGAIATGAWLEDTLRSFSIQKNGTYYTQGGFFGFGSSSHLILRGGSAFLEGGGNLVCMGTGVTSDDATGFAAALAAATNGLFFIGDLYSSFDLDTRHFGDFTVSRPIDGGVAKVRTGALVLRELSGAQITALGTPVSGEAYVYVKASDELAYVKDDDGTETLLGGGGGGGTSFSDADFEVYSAADATKIIAFSAVALTAGNTRTFTWQDQDGIVALLDAAIQEWTGVNRFHLLRLTDPTSGKEAILDAALLTADRNISFPDAAGTLALTSDLVHDHDADYSPIGHDHDADYQPLDADLTELAALGDGAADEVLAMNAGGTAKAWRDIADIVDYADVADLVDIGDVEANQVSLTDTDQGYTIPAGRLSADGEGLKIIARGKFNNGSGLKAKIGGVHVQFPGYASGFGGEGSGDELCWQIELDVLRDSATTLFVSGMFSMTGQDADVGSAADRVVLPGLAITLPGTGWATTVAVTVDYDTADGTERVNLLMIRRVGFGVGGSGGGAISGGILTGCRLVTSSTRTIPTATHTIVKFTDAEEEWDTHVFHDGGPAAVIAGTHGRIELAPGLAGVYLVTVEAQWDQGDKSQRHLYLVKNGTRVTGSTKAPEVATGVDDWQTFTVPLELEDGDQLEAGVWHNAGITVDLLKLTFTANRHSANSGFGVGAGGGGFDVTDNDGATGLTTVNLPPAVAGGTPQAIVVADTDGIEIVADGTDEIYLDDVVGSAPSWAADTIGSSALLVPVAGKWLPLGSVSGRWESPSTVIDASLLTNLVAYWPFEVDLFTDASGNSHTLSTSGSPTNPAASLTNLGNCWRGTGTGGQRLGLAHHTDFDFAAGNWTVAFWLKPANTSQLSVIADKNSGNWTIYQNGATLNVYGSFGGPTGIGTLTTGWQFVVVQRATTNVTVYINQVNVGGGGVGANTYATTTGNWTIGGRDAIDYPYNGDIDEFMVWKGRAVAIADLAQLYASGLAARLQSVKVVTGRS